MADKMDPQEAIKQILTLKRNDQGQLAMERPQGPLAKLFGTSPKLDPLLDQTNYINTARGALGSERTQQLLPGGLMRTPEGEEFLPSKQYDQVMEAARLEGDNGRLLSPEESALTIGYWKEAAPSLVPLAQSIVKAKGGLPEWLGKQGPSYRLKRSELGSVQGFTDDNVPVEYDITEKKWYVGGEETPANRVGRLLSKTRPQLTGEQVNEVTNLLNAQTQLKEVEKLFDPTAVGPVQNRLLSFQEFTGIKLPDLHGMSVLSDDKVRLRTVLSSTINDYIKAITGAQMSEPEARRIMKALPKAGSADEAFLPALQEIMKITKTKLNNRLDVLESQDTVGIKKLRELSNRDTGLVNEKTPGKISTASDYLNKFRKGKK